MMWPRPIQQIVDKAGSHPDDLALAFPTLDGDAHRFTWSTLLEEVMTAAAALHRDGVEGGDPLLILTASVCEQVISFLAAMAAGALPSILSYPSVKQTRETFLQTFNPIVANVGARWIVCGASFRDLPDDTRIRVLCASNRAAADTRALLRSGRSSRLFLQFSSGTTGLRKGVAITEEMLEAQVDACARRLALRDDDVFVSWLPLYHDMGLVGAFLLPLCCGLPSVHLSPFEWLRDPASILRCVSRYRGTVSYSPNFAYALLAKRLSPRSLESEGVSLASLRLVINCSEPVRVAAHEQFLSAFGCLGLAPGALQTSYAMAETTFAVTQTNPGSVPMVDRIDRKAFQETMQCVPAVDVAGGSLEFTSCGPPIDGIEVRIDGAEAERRLGEIWVRGRCVIDGYFGAGAAPILQPGGWFRTGDLGYLAGGELYVAGRAKDVIIHRGANLWPNDIEDLIARVEGCKAGRIVAFGVPDESLGTEDVVAVVEPEPSCADQALRIEREIRERVATELGVHLRDVVISGALLKKSTSGKMSRRAVRDAYLAEQAELPRPSPARADAAHYYKPSDALAWCITEDKCHLTLPGGGRLTVPAGIGKLLELLRDVPRTLEAIQKLAVEAKAQDILQRVLEAGALVPTGASDAHFEGDGFVAFLARPDSPELVVQFRGGCSDVIDGVPTYEFAAATGIAPHNLLMLRDERAQYYEHGVGDSLRSFTDLVAWLRGAVWSLAATSGIERVHCLGTSMGGSAALLAGHELRAQSAWAMSPAVRDEAARERLLRALREHNGVTRYEIWYGAENAPDSSLATALAECPGVVLHPVRSDSHLVALELWRKGSLPRLMSPARFATPRTRGRVEADAEGVLDVARIVAGRQGPPLDRSSSLISALDSFSMVRLFSELERKFMVRLDLTAFTQADMQDADALAAAVRRAQG